MAVQFHELPVSVFPKECRPYIARLNRELRDLFGLEGSLSSERTTTRSDATVARQNIATVDISRITPSITNVVSGASTVVGIPNLTLGTANAAGSTTTTIATDSSVALFDTVAPELVGTSAVGVVAYSARRDHSHGFSASFPSSWVATNSHTYATAAAAGTATTFARSDDVLVYPEALATAADRSKSIILTDSSAAALTCSNLFSGNRLNIAAPNATNSLSIGKWGNFGMAGNSATDDTMLLFSKIDFNESTIVRAINATVTNTGTGGANGIIVAAKNSGTNAIPLYGISLTAQNTNANSTGDLAGIRFTVNNTVSATRSNMYGMFLSSLTNLGTLTSAYGIRFPASIVCGTCTTAHGISIPNITGTITTAHGYNINNLGGGTTRVGYYCGGFTTGTPTDVLGMDVGAMTVGTNRYGVRVAAHTGGTPTLKRSFIGGDSFECTSSHMIVGTSGMGFVVKDTVDGNYYMISTAGGVIGSSSLGATLPAA